MQQGQESREAGLGFAVTKPDENSSAASPTASGKPTVVWVGGIPANVASDDESKANRKVADVFKVYGRVLQVQFRKKAENNSWAFVSFAKPEYAKKCLAATTNIDNGSGQMVALQVEEENVTRELQDADGKGALAAVWKDGQGVAAGGTTPRGRNE